MTSQNVQVAKAMASFWRQVPPHKHRQSQFDGSSDSGLIEIGIESDSGVLEDMWCTRCCKQIAAESTKRTHVFLLQQKIELTYLRLVYIQIQTHFSMFSAQQTSPSS